MKPEKQLYQWDVNQYLTELQPTAQFVDYPIGNEVIRIETDGTRCRIPDEVLQTYGGKTCYERYPDGTYRAYSFNVMYAPKPPDYVYTAEERTTFDALVAKADAAIAEIKRRADSGEFTPKKGVDYFTDAEKNEMMESVSSGAVGEFRKVVDTATTEYDTNAEQHTSDYNRNAAEKLEAYNSNHTEKVSEYSQNAETKMAEFDANAAALQTEVDRLRGECDNVAAEIVDARHGATVLGGFNYKSLGNAIRGQATDLFNKIDQVENLMFDITKGTNRFNASLVTNDTIYAGKQLTGSGTLIDNANTNVSPYLAIEPGVTYTMGLVPAYGSTNTPWYTLSTAIAFYDEDYTFVSRVNSTGSPVTFTTPTNAKYYRFNIYNSIGITLNLLAQRCMLVYGSSLPGSFTAFSDSMTLKGLAPIVYSISGDIITVASKYGDSVIEVEFGKRGPNNLPDFRYITTAGRVKYNNSSDWFGPFVLEALSNIDGDDPNRVTYTGGNHNYNDTGSMDYSATARNISLKYYADGKEIGNGEAGSCSILSIVWTNRVQAYNTRKADGTGREVLEERHILVFNGAEWETYLEIEALENIFCKEYYGLQCAIRNYGTIYMIGAKYRKPFVYTDPHDSGNYNPNIYVAYDQDDRLEMEVDRSVDLGRGSMYGSSGTQGFRTSGSKGYTYFVTQKNLAANDVYGARGWYRFIPQF